MSLRILFADDSVTAQNMGKKILSEAGYEVVAVSNGAAAVKKIAEQKPDIIILDVYMPGYSGLEVCEKVRGSMETAKIPVLLTVGKMEPYKPEDSNRVKADGVIVKPFEATDLLAIVKQFEERIRRTPASVAQPVLMDRSEEEESGATHAPEQAIAPPPSQHTVEVPDHMATSSAFSDLLGADASHSVDFQTPPPPPPPPRPPAAPAVTHSPLVDYEVPPNWRDRDEEFELPAPAVSAPSRPLQIPVYREREQGTHAYDMMPTAAPPTGDIEIARDPSLQENAAETTRNTIVDDMAPGLIPDLQQFLRQESEQGSRAKQAAEPTSAMAQPEQSTAETVSDADFEARVAAAMSAYSRHSDAKPGRSLASVPAVPERPAVVGKAPEEFVPTRGGKANAEREPAVDYYPPVRRPAPGVGSTPAQPKSETVGGENTAPTFEYHPPVSAPTGLPAPESSSKPSPFAVGIRSGNRPASADEAPGSESVGPAPQHSWPEPASLSDARSNDNHVSAPSSMEASALAAAAAETGADSNTIAQAVHRVMERLKPELVDEIVRELKSKK